MLGLLLLRGHRHSLLPGALLAGVLVLTLHVLLVIVESGRVAHRPSLWVSRIVQTACFVESVIGEFPVHLGGCRLGHAGLLHPCIPVWL